MKQELVRKALEAGLLLTPGLLEKLDEKRLEEMIKEAREKKKSVLTERERTLKSKLVIKVTRVSPKPKLTPEDFARYYKNKYEGIKKFLLKKIDAVSINKVRESYDDLAVIGMVKELTQKGFVLEDSTGEIEVVSQDQPDLDDVIGVRGASREGKLMSKEIVLPDVTLDSQSKIPNLSLFLTTSAAGKARAFMQSANFTLIPDLENEELDEKEKKHIITNFTNPTWITISNMGNEIKILVYNPGEKMEQKQATDCLRKRHLSPQRNKITGPDDSFLIDTVPDIFWIISPNRFLENYRGVTIISCESPNAARIDLGTRETEFKKI